MPPSVLRTALQSNSIGLYFKTTPTPFINTIFDIVYCRQIQFSQLIIAALAFSDRDCGRAKFTIEGLCVSHPLGAAANTVKQMPEPPQGRRTGRKLRLPSPGTHSPHQLTSTALQRETYLSTTALALACKHAH